MRYIVAVSGGIDSVVLLDMLAEQVEHELVVAHFDHGIREDSAADARFVGELAKHYSLPFVTKREELGTNVSEETARNRRYAFLKAEAKRRGAMIMTAHHADDVIETIAINITRGTGWRGAAVLDTPAITRPLLGMTKKAVREYAMTKRLEWVEDSTNAEAKYLRNRMRRQLSRHISSEAQQAVHDVWKRQIMTKTAIDDEVTGLLGEGAEHERYFIMNVDQTVAIELLRAIIMSQSGTSPTRPQLERAWFAIRTARSGTRYEVGDGVRLRFYTRTFIVETP